MKRNVFIIFAILLGSFVQLVAQNATPASDFVYELNADGTGIFIIAYKGSEKNVVIPSTIENYPVVELSSVAFTARGNLESITIPNSIKKIGTLTFAGCEKLKTVNIDAKNIEYVKDVSFIKEMLHSWRKDAPFFLSANESFLGCGALSLEEQKKIRSTGYRGYFFDFYNEH